MNDDDKTGAYQPGDADAPAVDDAAHPLPKQVGRYRVGFSNSFIVVSHSL